MQGAFVGVYPCNLTLQDARWEAPTILGICLVAVDQLLAYRSACLFCVIFVAGQADRDPVVAGYGAPGLGDVLANGVGGGHDGQVAPLGAKQAVLHQPVLVGEIVLGVVHGSICAQRGLRSYCCLAGLREVRVRVAGVEIFLIEVVREIGTVV